MIFNIVVDEVVQTVMAEVFGLKESHYGMGWAAGERNLILYVDYRRILGRDPDWV